MSWKAAAAAEACASEAPRVCRPLGPGPASGRRGCRPSCFPPAPRLASPGLRTRPPHLLDFLNHIQFDRMKKFKRRLSLTLRGSQTIDESLSELAEQMTIEENSSKDNEPIVKNGRPPTSHSMHSFLHQYTGSFKKPPLRRPHSVIGGSLGSFMAMPRNGSRLDIVHENLKMGSDGESDQASGTSSDEVQSPTGVCLRNRIHRRISMEDLNKRLSLPADIRIPDGYLEKLQINSPPFDQPMSRRSRRASLVSF